MAVRLSSADLGEGDNEHKCRHALLPLVGCGESEGLRHCVLPKLPFGRPGASNSVSLILGGPFGYLRCSLGEHGSSKKRHLGVRSPFILDLVTIPGPHF